MEDTCTEARKKESVTMTVEDKPLSMLSWGSEAMQDYVNVYKRKCSENKDEQAAIWTSMYEKNLGRKVSDLPPWLGPNANSQQKFGDPEKTDFASIHKARAAESCEANATDFMTAEQRRHHRKKHRSRRSGSDDSTTSSHSDHDQVRSNCSSFDTTEEEQNDLSQSTED
ncbi:uncharacterized protein LOC116304001 [Actinia tenebrosa]|uniref:Uncharacterized protein LOC116304001 n=1 Tax=Actinia tenebrosa TaxID=6105 RepID=A0A6P8IRK6_ACTTE|nr:uncharacterized protein LOC116304001 [Actinia tenebrosa]